MSILSPAVFSSYLLDLLVFKKCNLNALNQIISDRLFFFLTYKYLWTLLLTKEIKANLHYYWSVLCLLIVYCYFTGHFKIKPFCYTWTQQATTTFTFSNKFYICTSWCSKKWWSYQYTRPVKNIMRYFNFTWDTVIQI